MVAGQLGQTGLRARGPAMAVPEYVSASAIVLRRQLAVPSVAALSFKLKTATFRPVPVSVNSHIYSFMDSLSKRVFSPPRISTSQVPSGVLKF